MKRYAKIGLVIVGVIALLYVPSAIGFMKPDATVVTNIENVPVAPPVDEYSVYNLVNDERAKAGLVKLTLDPRIEQAAQTKCNDLVTQNYWSHTDPQGRMPWHLFEENGYAYRHAGENLAEEFATNNAVISGWMNSPEHRSNILMSDYRSTGVAVCHRADLSVVIVQEFASPR